MRGLMVRHASRAIAWRERVRDDDDVSARSLRTSDGPPCADFVKIFFDRIRSMCTIVE